MKKIVLIFSLLMLSNLLVKAQNQSYTVHHKNGDITPAKGNDLLTDAVAKKLLFDHKYYVLIQFENLPTLAIKNKLAIEGVELFSFLNNRTFYAAIAEKNIDLNFDKYAIHAVFGLSLNNLKLDKRLIVPKTDAPWAVTSQAVKVVLEYIPGSQTIDIKKRLVSLFGVSEVTVKSIGNYIQATVNIESLSTLVNEPYISWIEPIHPPLTTDNLPGKTGHGSMYIGNPLNRGLTGKNIKVGEWDGGFIGHHIDFGDRKKNIDSLVYSDHATHVAGTIASNGTMNYTATGMAPEATVYGNDFYNDIQAEMDSVYNQKGIVLTNNSYGYDPTSDNCTIKGSYDSESSRIDALVVSHQDLIHVFSSGNAQSQCSGGFRTVSSGFNSSKNIITVGATDYKGVMTNFSSWGPTLDGRVKPEVCGVGVSVFSTINNNVYVGSNGTSMSAPGVTGTIAQLCELYNRVYNTNANASVMRAILCNTATDAGNAHVDFKFGYGNINGVKAATVIDSNWFLTDTVSTGNYNDHSLLVPSGVRELKVTLAWTDKEGSGSASSVLVNNLDLYIINPIGDTIRPWVLNPASPSSVSIQKIDTVNNIEQITIDNPIAGNYTIYIAGTNVPFGPQLYALTWLNQKPEILVVYPNGGEKWKPGASETIRWLSSGVTGNYTVQYSVDSGANWITLSSTVTNKFFDWTIPNVASNKVMVRVTATGFRDSSDAVFTIYPFVTNLSAKPCMGAVNLTWTAVSGASYYNIYRLDNSTFKWTKIDTIGSSFTKYTDKNVNNGELYYYTISAVNASGVQGNVAAAVFTTPNSVISNLVTNSGAIEIKCGETINLTSATAPAYLWNTGATTQNISVSQTGNYSVQLTYDTGCVAQSEIQVITDAFNIQASSDSVCNGSTSQLQAFSSQLNTIRLTEIIQSKAGTGATVTYPSWITGASANADYVEVSNIGNDTLNIGGMSFELWNDTSLIRTYTWPSYASLPPSTLSVLHIGNTATNDSTKLFFNTGGSDDPSTSADARGYILKDSLGNIVDAVATNFFVFPAISNVTNNHWLTSTSSPFLSGLAGTRLKTADNNRGNEWTAASTSNRIDLGVYNVTLASIERASVSWYDGATFITKNLNFTPLITTNKTYTCSLTTNTCLQIKNIDIYVVNTSTPTVRDSIQCGAGIPTCFANGTGAIKWYSDSIGGSLLQTSGNTYITSISSSTNFWVSNFDNGCESPRVKLIQTVVSSAPAISIINKTGKLCAGELLQLNANSSSNNYTYTWSASNNGGLQQTSGDSVFANPTSNSMFYLNAYDASNTCVNNDSILVSIYNKPVVNIQSSKTVLCQGDSINIFVQSSSSNDWRSHYLVIQYDATQGVTGLQGASKVYMHSGITDTNTVGASQTHIVGNWGQDDGIGQMTSLGNDQWELMIDLNEYYGVNSDSTVKYIAMIFRNEDGTSTGKDNSNQYIYVDVKSGNTISSFAGVTANYHHQYQWIKDGASISNTTSNIYAKDSGIYIASDLGLICSDSSQPIHITFDSIAIIGSITIAADSICLGDSVQLQANNTIGNISWEYYNGNNWQSLNLTGNSVYISPSTTIDIRAKATANCNVDSSISKTIVVKTSPAHSSISLSRDTICPVDTVTLTWNGNSGQVIDWLYLGNSTGKSNNPEVLQITQAAYILARISNNNGCADIYDSVSIATYDKPYAGVLSSTKASICYNDSFNLYVDSTNNGIVTFEFADQLNNNQFTYFYSAGYTKMVKTQGQGFNSWGGTSYRVKVSNANCPDAYSNVIKVTIDEYNIPGSVTSSKDSICPFEQVTLTYTPKGPDKWYNQKPSDWLFSDSVNQWVSLSSTDTFINAVPSKNTTFRAAFYMLCDTDYVDYNIYINPHAIKGTIVASKNNICKGTTSTLSSFNHVGNVVWQEYINGTYVDIASAIVLPATSTAYRAKYELGTCDSVFSDSLYINVTPMPVGGQLSATVTATCVGDTSILKLQNFNGTITWQMYDSTQGNWVKIQGNSDTLLIINIGSSKYYRAALNNGNCGPEYSNDYLLNVPSNPTVGNILSSNNNICPNTPIKLYTSYYTGSLTWQQYDTINAVWNTLINADTLPLVLSQSVTYRAYITLGNCGNGVYSSPYKVVIKEGPQFDSIIASQNKVCVGTAVQLNMMGNIVGVITWQEFDKPSQSWQNKLGNTNQFFGYPYDTTIYRAIVINNGCSKTSNVLTITTNPAPFVIVTPSGSTTLCSGETVDLTASSGNGFKYQWQKDTIDIFAQNSKVYKVTTSGDYRVIITNPLGCSASSANITVVVNPLPAVPVITRAGYELDAGVAGLTYQWYNNSVPISGANQQKYTIAQAGSYTVKVTNSFGCSALSQPYITNAISNVTNQTNINIYPNPSTGIFNLSFDGIQINAAQIKLFDMNGKELKCSIQTINSQLLNIDLNETAKGVYILQVLSSQENIYMKLIKE